MDLAGTNDIRRYARGVTIAESTIPGVTLRPLRRVEYDALVEMGLLEDERVELLEGALVELNPKGGRHARLVTGLNRLLSRRLPEELMVSVAAPYVADDLSEPEPDLAVVPYRSTDEHPDSALLVIEVSRSSLSKDLGVKARTYARSGVPEYWVVDVIAEVVHVHTGPVGEGWTRITQVGFATPFEVAGGGSCWPSCWPDAEPQAGGGSASAGVPARSCIGTGPVGSAGVAGEPSSSSGPGIPRNV